MDEIILWTEVDIVTNPDTGQTGTITSAGNGQDLDTMEIKWGSNG